MTTRDLDPSDYHPTRLALKLSPPCIALEYKTGSILKIHKIPLPFEDLVSAARGTLDDHGPETDEDAFKDQIVQDALQFLRSSEHQPYLEKLDIKQIEGLLQTATSHHLSLVGSGSNTPTNDAPSSPVERELAKADCWLDITINDKPVGRVVISLRDDIVPKTAANFRRMCVGTFRSKSTGNKLHYKGTSFFRIIPGFVCQGGDVVSDDGFGSDSIYGGDFPDENFTLKHNKPGTLSMANDGPGTNGSQFFMTLQPTPHLDNDHVVFGRVTRGMHVLTSMELAGTADGENMTKKVLVADCGLVQETP